MVDKELMNESIAFQFITAFGYGRHEHLDGGSFGIVGMYLGVVMQFYPIASKDKLRLGKRFRFLENFSVLV